MATIQGLGLPLYAASYKVRLKYFSWNYMKLIKAWIEKAKTARDSVVQHWFRTLRKTALFGVISAGFWFATQDSGLLFWLPVMLMVFSGLICLVMLAWSVCVGLVLWRVDSTVGDAMDYTDLAVGVHDFACKTMQERQARRADESSTSQKI